MTLFEKLQKASSEEDVKDAYIKALGLKEYNKNLVDIQTKEIWMKLRNRIGRITDINNVSKKKYLNFQFCFH